MWVYLCVGSYGYVGIYKYIPVCVCVCVCYIHVLCVCVCVSDHRGGPAALILSAVCVGRYMHVCVMTV